MVEGGGGKFMEEGVEGMEPYGSKDDSTTLLI